MRTIYGLAATWLLLCLPALAQTVGQPLPAWTPGSLDIHQINTGKGNSALFLLPDGTTMLVDAGDGAIRIAQGATAHEVGHLCGLGHDTESPRSLMNVVEAVGLDFDWAEWIPSHAKTVESFLGREPAEKP